MNVHAAFEENGQPVMTIEDCSVRADLKRAWLAEI
jgi:hypothetical protein